MRSPAHGSARTAPPHPPLQAHTLTQAHQRQGNKRATTQAARREEDAEEERWPSPADPRQPGGPSPLSPDFSRVRLRRAVALLLFLLVWVTYDL